MIEAQRAVLGDESMERYRDYMDTLGARHEVVRLDARLASGRKLQAEQKARLISLIHEHEPLRKQKPARTSRGPLVAATTGMSVQSQLAQFDIAGHMDEEGIRNPNKRGGRSSVSGYQPEKRGQVAVICLGSSLNT